MFTIVFRNMFDVKNGEKTSRPHLHFCKESRILTRADSRMYLRTSSRASSRVSVLLSIAASVWFRQ